jgi:spore coat polysaccharide biosynthesis protein SpsF
MGSSGTEKTSTGKFRSRQESAWAGIFGNEYTKRNMGEDLLSIPARTAMYAKIFSHTKGVESVIEFGANVGANVRAITQLLPHIRYSAVEINTSAIKRLKALGRVDRIYHTSLLSFVPEEESDFAFTQAVLIHINPDLLPDVYDRLYAASRRYICVTEYFNPTPVSVPYRGRDDLLFKRDFAGDLLDRFSDLRLVGYGFNYSRDNTFPLGNSTWFLLEKRK